MNKHYTNKEHYVKMQCTKYLITTSNEYVMHTMNEITRNLIESQWKGFQPDNLFLNKISWIIFR